jgi:hypothetical protein
MKKTDEKVVELQAHWKQGDDFADHLKAKRGKVTHALNSWADDLVASAEALRAISRKLEGERGVKAFADTHTVLIRGLSPALAAEVVAVSDGHAMIEKPEGSPNPDEEE